jgi:mitochondrial fission protein ELM1
MAEPLRIWAVSDGRAGIENQALGLAEAVARLTPAEITVKRIGWRGPLGRLPTRVLGLAPLSGLSPESDPVGPPWPDLWIGAGRAVLPLSIRMRRWSGGRSFVVQTQDPRLPSRLFDLVVPPEHDALAGPNVFSILGSPHRVTAERLAREAEAFAGRLSGITGSKAAVLIGGKSRAFDLPPQRAETLGRALRTALEAEGASVLATFSRRTPPAARRALGDQLSAGPGWVWDGEGPNPYFAFLAAADVILVTEDSINMAAEAAATGKPVHILPMLGGSARIARFHAALRARGASRPFEGRLERWTYEPLRETDRAAAEVLRRMGAR